VGASAGTFCIKVQLRRNEVDALIARGPTLPNGVRTKAGAENGEGEDMMTDEEREVWLASRKEAGLKIDPETAEVFFVWRPVDDPYGVYPFPEHGCIGRAYFARSPGSDVWVEFGDLPAAVFWRLEERIKSGEFDC
jgi:hypothetical protein